MRRILAVVIKEFRQIRRTKAYFALIFIAPFVQLVVMGFALSSEVKHVPLLVVDLDDSQSSRAIENACSSTASFDYLGPCSSEALARQLLDSGRAKVAVVIPRHFDRDRRSLANPQLQILADGVDGNTAGLSLSYLEAILLKVQQNWASAEAPSLSGAGPAQISIVSRMWYNPNLDSKLNFVPGMMGILLIIVTTFLTAVNIVRERELGTLEQIMVTPLSGIQLMIGKAIPFTILGFAQLGMSLVAAALVFGIVVKGSLLLLYAMTLVFCFSTVGMGIFISTIVQTQQQAMFVAWFSAIFEILLSGFLVPLENMPLAVQYLSLINPLRYFILILREIFLKGSGFAFIWKEALIMTGIGAAMLLAATVRFQKRLD